MRVKVIVYFSYVLSVDFLKVFIKYSILPFLNGFFPEKKRENKPLQLSCYINKVNSLVVCLLCFPAFTSVHDYWQDYNLDYMDHCRQTDVFTL